jgi:hypothetical protein
VVIQHGVLYGIPNLSSVSVSQGEKVSGKQTIGKVRTNGDTGKTVKFFYSQNTVYTIHNLGYQIDKQVSKLT